MISAAFQPFVMSKWAKLTKQQKESKMTTTKEQLARVEAELAELKLKIEAEEKAVEPMFPALSFNRDYYYMGSGWDADKDVFTRHGVDRARFDCGNAFTDEAQAQACAGYLKDRFWFIRKAIEFADGYEFEPMLNNHFIIRDTDNGMWESVINQTLQAGDIYMNGESGDKFVEWLNIHKPEGF